jgi:hypothetical protein
MKAIVSYETPVRKFFSESGLAKIFTAKAAGMLAAFLIGMAARGFRGKMVDLERACGACRTTFSRFLSGGKWSGEDLGRFIKKYALRCVLDKAKATGLPIFVIIDDTVNPKSKPSGSAKDPTEGAGFHHSHLLNESVWGRRAVAVTPKRGDLCLNYDVWLYDKTTESKIDYVMRLAEELPEAEAEAAPWRTAGARTRRSSAHSPKKVIIT